VLPPAGPHGLRLLSTFDLGEPPDNGRIGDCCREDCPFQPVRVAAPGLVSVALAPVARCANLDCRPVSPPASLAFTRHPALCSSDFPRTTFPPPATILSPLSLACQRAGSFLPTTVPKGRFELPRVSPLRPERSASADSATSARFPPTPRRGSRPGDSNPRPALYERAALPTELGRRVLEHDCRFYQPPHHPSIPHLPASRAICTSRLWR
jgi:hypothetical protein